MIKKCAKCGEYFVAEPDEVICDACWEEEAEISPTHQELKTDGSTG